MKLVKLPNGIYHIQYRGEGGKRCQVSTKTKDREIAQQIAKKSCIEELEVTSRAARLSNTAISQIMAGSDWTVEKAFMAYEQWARAQTTARWTLDTAYFPTIKCWIRDMNLEGKSPYVIDDVAINTWLNRKGEWKLNTRNKWMYAIKHFFTFLSAKGWCLGNPSMLARINEGALTHAQKEPVGKVCFTDEEVERLIASQADEDDPFWLCAIVFGRYAGLRFSDIAQMQWAMFTDHNSLRFQMEKTDKVIEIPFSQHPRLEEAKNLMFAVKEMPFIRHDAVYCWPYACENYQDELGRTALIEQFRRICHSVDIHGKTFHCLRHTFATRMKQEGKTVEEIAEAMGHRTRVAFTPFRVTEGYIHEEQVA